MSVVLQEAMSGLDPRINSVSSEKHWLEDEAQELEPIVTQHVCADEGKKNIGIWIKDDEINWV